MADPVMTVAEPTPEAVSFETHPTRYRHWQLSIAGAVARLTLNVNEDATIRPGYRSEAQLL